MKQDSKRLFSIIIALLFVVVAVVVYFDLIVPAYTNLQEVKGQELSEQTLYTNEQQIVSEVKNILATYQTNSSSSQSVALALPVGQNVAAALAQIYGIGTNSGVVVQSTAISVQAVQAPVADTTSAGGVAGAAAAGSIIKPTGSVSVQITGTGSYEAFKTFLEGLETNIRIFDVTSISLSPASAVGAKGAITDLFNYNITVVTYYQAP